MNYKKSERAKIILDFIIGIVENGRIFLEKGGVEDLPGEAANGKKANAAWGFRNYPGAGFGFFDDLLERRCDGHPDLPDIYPGSGC